MARHGPAQVDSERQFRAIPRRRSAWTPYDGREVMGWPVRTMVRGVRVMWDGDLTGPARGEAVRFAG